MEKLVVYFSKSGNTKIIAERIEQQHLVKYHRIQPDQPYPDEFRKLQAVSQDEVLFGKTRAIKGIDRDLWEKYSEVIIGTPTYWGHLPACVCQFLKENDFGGKSVTFFVTCAGDPLNLQTELERWKSELIEQSDFLF